ncbi:ATPase, T2SS/T4P/T4SS family, partial [Acinetobacter baumannii]
YAALSELNRVERKLLTVEDPIEYRLPGVIQTQVHPAIGFTFASALRSFLRQDPDVIMVGEIRDSETARIAVQAALT